MRLSYNIRPYIIKVTCFVGFIPLIGFSFLSLSMPINLALFATLPLFIVLLPMLICLFRQWNSAYIFTSKKVTYVINGKRLWSLEIKNIDLKSSGLNVVIRSTDKIITPHWITRRKFEKCLELSQASNRKSPFTP